MAVPAKGSDGRPQGKWMARPVSIALGTLFALLLAEIALRLGAALFGPSASDLSRTAEISPPPVAGDCRAPSETAPFAAMVRPSAVTDIIYELKPGLDTCFQGVRVRTNSEGVRAAVVHRRPKPPGVFRILLLGDSQAFGWGIEEPDTLGAQLAARLRGPGAAEVEVVNAGVPGYNAVQESAWLRARGLAYEPDCVVVLYIDNDLALPTLLLRPTSALLSGHSFLLARLAPVFSAAGREGAVDPWLETPREFLGRVRDEDLWRIPPAYAHMVGVAGYRRALRSFAESARSRGIPVINVADYQGPEIDWPAIEREQAALGIVHVQPDFPWDAPQMWLSENDPHLAPRAIAELARRVEAALKRRNVCRPPGDPPATATDLVAR